MPPESRSPTLIATPRSLSSHTPARGDARLPAAPEHTDVMFGRAPSTGRRAVGLRARVTFFFSVTGLVAALGLASVTYFVTRSYLLDQRRDVAEIQTVNNARLVRDSLRRPGAAQTREDLIDSVRTDAQGYAVLHIDAGDQRFGTDTVGLALEDLPPHLRQAVGAGSSGYEYFTLGDDPYLAYGVSLADPAAQYYEAFPLTTIERDLRVIATALAIGAASTALLSAALGWWASRRLLRPVSRVADAATELASGGLDTRLPPDPDPDLDRLSSSFNEMADAVQARIQREARFASDVSHELRSPITALTAAVEVMDARRADIPARSQQALDVVVNQVRRFDQMVLDLLELSRLDAGVAELNREELVLDEMVRRIATRHGYADVPIEVGPGADVPVPVDKRRLERIVANLLDNARQHADGPTRVTVSVSRVASERAIDLAVEDSGPGVALSERTRIFERYARGTASRSRVGTGLGLALVLEHAQAHGGRAWVEDRTGGGSRFVVRFPLAPS